MHTTKKFGAVTVAALVVGTILSLGAGAVSRAAAESWRIQSGRNSGTFLPGDSRKLADGSTYLTGGSKVVVETEDPTYPITGQTMDCRWTCVISADSKADCVTLCCGVDKDGDLFSFVGKGAMEGTYTVGPGTRKYVDATGGGTFKAVTLSDPALSHTRWEGTLELRQRPK